MAGAVLPALAIGILMTLACRWAAGEGLGLFLGGIAAAFIAMPALVLSERRLSMRLLVVAGMAVGVSAVWLPAVWHEDINFAAWGRCVVVLLACTLAISGAACALERIGLPSAAAAALAMAIGLAWLSWPVWMSPVLANWSSQARESIVAMLVAAHPPLTVNSTLSAFFPVPWPQHPIMYGYSSIGSDTSYTMPPGIGACVAGHLFAAVALGEISVIPWRRPQPGPSSPAHPPVG